jgi:hypothetical protein
LEKEREKKRGRRITKEGQGQLGAPLEYKNIIDIGRYRQTV